MSGARGRLAQSTLISLSAYLSVALSISLSACQDPSSYPRALESGAEPKPNDEEAGAQAGGLSGEQGAGEQRAGELGGDVAGALPSGESVAGVMSPEASPLSCADGLLRGPMWLTSADSDELMISREETRPEPSEESQRRAGVYGHYRRFHSDHWVAERDLKRARSSSHHSVLAIIHGAPELISGHTDLWRSVEPIGRGFWVINIPKSELPQQLHGYLMLVEDKWDHRLPPLSHERDADQEITARLTLWAPNRDALDEVKQRPEIARALKHGSSTLDPRLGDRETPLMVTHAHWSPRSGTTQKHRSARVTTRPLTLSVAMWRELLKLPHVLWAGPPEALPTTLNAPSRSLMGTDQVTRPQRPASGKPLKYLGWSGEGVRVGVMDSGVAVHPDFYQYEPNGDVKYDRIRGDLPPSQYDGHGTTVAGILAGNGFASAQHTTALGLPNEPFQWRGQAPLVSEIYSHLMYGTGDGREDPAWTQIFDEQRAHLANHSHTFGNGYYTPETQGYDAFISGIMISESQREEGGLAEAQSFSHPPRPVFLAAGNNGQSPRDNFFMKLHGYYGLLVNLKNGVIVGSVNSNDAQHVDSSSLGPTLDGRLKPDLSAPGSSDYRPLEGFKIELGEIRLHARRGSGVGDIVWRWGRTHSALGDWTGQGAFSPEESLPEAGVLRGETFGSYFSRIQWSRPDEAKAVDARNYESISFEVRVELPEGGSGYDPRTPLGKTPLPISHRAPEVWMLRWGDDQGRGYDETRYVRHKAELSQGEWTRVRYRFDEEWSGDISRLRFTPAIYWGGIYTPSIWGGYEMTSGTSMASPAVAGVGALALSQLADQHEYDLESAPPSPALIRGLLMHTARDLERSIAPPRVSPSPDTGFAPMYFEGPDFATGYGLVDAHATSRLIDAGAESPRWYEGEITPGEELTFTISATESGPLKVTLSWDDPPGSVVSPPWAPKLIHDLDLALISPSGRAHGPWVLAPPPLRLETYTSGLDELALFDISPARRCIAESIEELWSEAQRDPESDAELLLPERVADLEFAPHGNLRCLDNLNPLEQVLIDVPEPGEYRVRVRGPRAGGSVQRFALIASQSCALESITK